MFKQASAQRAAAMLILAGMLAAAGCQSGAQQGAMSPTQVPTPTAVLQQVQGDQSGIQMPAVYLVQSADDVEQLGVAPLVAGLNADLTSQDVIIVALGQKPTLGYAVRITGVQSMGDTYYVQGVATGPTGDAKGEALTMPYAAVKVERTGAAQVRSEIASAQ